MDPVKTDGVGNIKSFAAHYPGRAVIDAYGSGGFRFAGMSHRGSILCLPSGIYKWEAIVPTDLTLQNFIRPLAESANFDLLLIGCGVCMKPLNKDLRQALAEHGIRFEVLSTGTAARMYNIMVGEERRIAAALLAVS